MITAEELAAITVAAGAEEETDAYKWATDEKTFFFSHTSYILGTWYKAVPSGQTGSTELSWLVENTSPFVYSGATANAYGEENFGYWTLSSIGYHVYGVTSSGNMEEDERVY